MLASASGELKTRSEPDSDCMPAVSLKTPPLPFTCLSLRYSSRLQSATSSPNMTMRGSRAISSFRQALMRSAIVLGKRVRIRPDHMSVHKRRAITAANVIERSFEGRITRQRIGAIHLGKMEVRKSLHQIADVPARSANFYGNRNGVLVVFDEVKQRQLEIRGCVQRLPEFAFTGGAVTGGDVSHLVTMEGHVLELAIVAAGLLRRHRMAAEIPAGFGTTHGLQKLGPRRRRRRDDVQLLMSPV